MTSIFKKHNFCVIDCEDNQAHTFYNSEDDYLERYAENESNIPESHCAVLTDSTGLHFYCYEDLQEHLDEYVRKYAD